MILPSYEEATSYDYWNIVAPYVSSIDLCSAAQVCSRWHEIFAPQLWGNPSSHFITSNDAVFTALSSFRRILPKARFYVRQMTHTLYLPSAHAEFYGGPHADWLLTLLKRLPNLRCLVVDGLPFFDHAALLCTRRAITTVGGSSIGPMEFPLRILNASNCHNCTHTGLSEALLHFTGLVHLDLSYTAGVRHGSVFQALSKLPCLQSLKLRGVGLTDYNLRAIGENTGLRLRTLDVRDNLLTDHSALILLELCFKYAAANVPEDRSNSEQGSQEFLSRTDATALYRQCGTNISHLIRNRLAIDILQDMAMDHDSLGGIINIYLSGNRFSAEGICDILRTSRVQMLDVGMLCGRGSELDHDSGPSPVVSALRPLISTLARFCGTSMRNLRVHHSIITGYTSHTASGDSIGEATSGLLTSKVTHEAEVRHQELRPKPRTRIQTQVMDDERGVHAGSQRDCGVYPEERRLSRTPRTRSVVRPRSFSASKANRDGFFRSRKATSVFLTPAHLPALETLVLTDVPEMDYDSTLADRLIDFIKDCAVMTALAKDEARVAYHQPPGRSVLSFESEYIRSIIALHRIVIEMKPLADKEKAFDKPQTSKSSTADKDSEALWHAAQGDFTFFDEGDDALQHSRSAETTSQPSFDVVARLVEFRKDRNMVFERALERGDVDPVIEGYWPGEVRIERAHLNAR